MTAWLEPSASSPARPLTTKCQRDDPKSGFPDRGGKFPDPLIQFPVTRQKFPVQVRREFSLLTHWICCRIWHPGIWRKEFRDEFARDNPAIAGAHILAVDADRTVINHPPRCRPSRLRFTQPTATVQTWRPELVFMPHTCRSLYTRDQLSWDR